MKNILLMTFLSFIIALILFGTSAWFVVEALQETITSVFSPSKTTENGSADSGKNADEEFRGSSFTACAIGLDDNGDMDAILLVRVDKITQRFVFFSIPRDFIINVDGTLRQMKSLYNLKDTDYILDKIYAITGFEIDYYVFLKMSGFENIIKILGGINFTVPQAMKYTQVPEQDENEQQPQETNPIPTAADEPEEYYSVNLEAGLQSLNAEQIIAMLRYNNYASGEIGKMDTLRSFAREYMKQKLIASNITKAPEVYSQIKNLIADTNFNLDSLLENIDIIFAFSEYKTSYNYTYKTNYVNTGTGLPSDKEPNAIYVDDVIEKLAEFKRDAA